MGRSVQTRIDIIFVIALLFLGGSLFLNTSLEDERVRIGNHRLLLEVQRSQIESLGRKFLQVHALRQAGDRYDFDVENLSLEIEPRMITLGRLTEVMRSGGKILIDREERDFHALPASEHAHTREIDRLINAFYFVREDLEGAGEDAGSRLVLFSSVLNRTMAVNKAILSNLERRAERILNLILVSRAVTLAIGVSIIILLRLLISRVVLGPLKELSDVLVPMSSGSLKRPRTIDREDEIGELFRHFGSFVEKLREVVMVVQRSSRAVSEESEQVREISEGIAKGVASQAATASETSRAMEQMMTLIDDTKNRALETKVIADMSNQAADEGRTAVVESIEAMEQVVKKIMVVEQIAQETNLLALNAAVEAARAGEGSKSFAVIAANVRKLAESSKEAAREVSAISAETMKIARHAEGTIHKIGPNTQKTAELVESISTAGKNQADQAVQINQAVQQLEDVTRDNARISDRMVKTADHLYQEVFRLEEMIEFFRLEDDPGETGAKTGKGAE